MCDGLNAAEIAAGGIDSYNPCGCGHIQKSAFNNREDCRQQGCEVDKCELAYNLQP